MENFAALHPAPNPPHAMEQGPPGDFNYVFVSLVQGFPCLYNTSIQEYYNPVSQEMAWTEIAQKLGNGITPAGCKSRWAILRKSFVEHLRPDIDKPQLYYLADILQFLLPFVDPGEMAAKQEQNTLTELSPHPSNSECSERPSYRKISLALIKQIQRYPFLYDNSTDRSNLEEERRKAWLAISKIVKVSPNNCRIRWNSIRAQYSLYLKAEQPQKIKKIYYLAKSLEFLKPFMRNYYPDEQPFKSNEQCNRLAELVRHYPCLYDDSLKKKTMQSVRIQAWTDISRSLGGICSAEDCMVKWGVIRNRYGKYLLRRPQEQTPSCKLWTTLKFLNPFMKQFSANEKQQVGGNGSSDKQQQQPVEQQSSVTLESEPVEAVCSNRLAELVMHFPCLYDHSSTKKSLHHVRMDAWREIARNFGAACHPQDCLTKWGNIRNTYSRYLKQPFNMRKPRKLWDTLKFLDPFMRKNVPLDGGQITTEQPPNVKIEFGLDYSQY